MTIDEQRIMKLDRVTEVSFTGRDMHGDFISVDIKGSQAHIILSYLKSGITDKNYATPLMII